MVKSSYDAYYKTNVQTSDQLSLIVMLYDGAIRFLKKAKVKINENDIEGSHLFMTRARDIVNELLTTLRTDDQSELSNNLQNLYVYLVNKITEANLKKDQAIIDECLSLLNTLKEGWQHVKEKQQATKEEQVRTQARKLRVQG